VLPVHPEAATGLAERLMDVKLPNPGAVNTRHRGFWFASGVEVFDPSFDRNVSVNAVGVVAVVDVGLMVKFCSLMSAKAGPANTATRTAAVVARTAALKNLLYALPPLSTGGRFGRTCPYLLRHLGSNSPSRDACTTAWTRVRAPSFEYSFAM